MMSNLPKHLFVSCDGSLYDTRLDNWADPKNAVRSEYSRSYREITNCNQLKATIRAGRFAWPGGYPMFFHTSDGGSLSFESARYELSNILHSIKTVSNDGWRVVGCEINYEDNNLLCDHSGNSIESAYN